MTAPTVGAVPVTGISELVLETADLDRSLAFYRDVLGFVVIRRSELKAWLLAGGNTRLGLWTPELGPGIANGRGGRHVHYAFNLDDSDFEAAVAHLRMRGLEVEVHDSRGEGRGRAAYVADPDGNVVELWTLPVSPETEIDP